MKSPVLEELHRDDRDGHEDDHDKHTGNEDHENKAAKLSERQIKRMGLVQSLADELRIRENIYRIPSAGLVQVESDYEVYLLSEKGSLQRITVQLLEQQVEYARIRMPVIPGNSAIIVHGAGLARLAFLNASAPESHDH
jgi:hypothetical protein